MQLPARRPVLKDIVTEAARALARLDADRLEELALSCRALNRDLACDSTRDVTCDSSSDANGDGAPRLLPIKEAERARLAGEARAARREMAVLARVLEATRANVQVIERLRELRLGRLEYKVGNSAGQTVEFDPHWPPAEGRPGEPRHGSD